MACKACVIKKAKFIASADWTMRNAILTPKCEESYINDLIETMNEKCAECPNDSAS